MNTNTTDTDVRYRVQHYTAPPATAFGSWQGWAVYAYSTTTGKERRVWGNYPRCTSKLRVGGDIWLHNNGGPKANRELLAEQKRIADDICAKLNAKAEGEHTS